MKVNAICMVKNEVDIIAETFENALKFCNKIYVFDNGSTDGSWELIQKLAAEDQRIEVADHSDEVFKNQLRNRVYNKYNHLYTDQDWWYILDADEMLIEDPRPMLEKAYINGYDSMRVWQAQFYFTDKDMENYADEDTSASIVSRRRYYKINWREVRFFINRSGEKWPESTSGRIPEHCHSMAPNSPICRHYAQRTPEQIAGRVKLRADNPYSFFHIKSALKDPEHSWVQKSQGLNYWPKDGHLYFSLRDKCAYFQKEVMYWIKWRTKSVLKVLHVS